jgi:hypothetical protein
MTEKRVIVPIVGLLALLVGSLAFIEPVRAQSQKALTNGDVIEMVQLGLGDGVIIDKIHAAPTTAFDTSIAGLKALKEAKVSDAVIQAMIDPRAGATSAAPAKVNPNDPNAPHDPGIYMYTEGKSGPQLTMLEPTVYQQGKTGGLFKSAMTYGIAKVKWKAVVEGSHASVRTSDPNVVFYFYFEESNSGLSNASFGGTTTPNEFTLLKFDEKKDSRETIVMQANAFGASSGTDQKAAIRFSFTKLRAGVYKVAPSAPLNPGEYCFLSSSGIGAYGAGAAGANRLFDFSVVPPE